MLLLSLCTMITGAGKGSVCLDQRILFIPKVEFYELMSMTRSTEAVLEVCGRATLYEHTATVGFSCLFIHICSLTQGEILH